MRVLPRSLFGRLVLILLAGLLFAQFASLAVNMRERRRLLDRFDVRIWAQRVSDTATLMSGVDPPTRRRIAALLSHPHLRVSIRQHAVPVQSTSGPEQAHARRLRAQLRSVLGPAHRFRVQIAPADSRLRELMKPPSLPHPPAHAPPPPREGPIVLTQVRLADGSWLVYAYSGRHPGFGPWPGRLLLTLAILVVAIILVSLVAVRWVTQPLSRLARAADALGRDIDRPPMPETGPLEALRAAQAFNRMQARLQAQLAERSRILTAVSHDLKTPITRLRLRLEMMDGDDLREKFGRDLDDMENLVNSTLDFMRGLEGREPVQPVDIQALIETIQADAEELGQAVSVHGQALAPYPGRPRALRRCLENLVGNAVKYAGGAEIEIKDDPRRLTIRVLDSGPGIPEAELERVFEPYYRLDPARTAGLGGSGLGLGIARRLAESHGGSLVLVNRVGGGLSATVTLPRDPSGS